MSIQLQARVTALESEVRELRQTLEEILRVQCAVPPAHNPNGPRQMCPKCHEKPNYHLHVKHCKGPSKPEATI